MKMRTLAARVEAYGNALLKSLWRASAEWDHLPTFCTFFWMIIMMVAVPSSTTRKFWGTLLSAFVLVLAAAARAHYRDLQKKIAILPPILVGASALELHEWSTPPTPVNTSVGTNGVVNPASVMLRGLGVNDKLLLNSAVEAERHDIG